jgi:hypothetical protein
MSFSAEAGWKPEKKETAAAVKPTAAVPKRGN